MAVTAMWLESNLQQPGRQAGCVSVELHMFVAAKAYWNVCKIRMALQLAHSIDCRRAVCTASQTCARAHRHQAEPPRQGSHGQISHRSEPPPPYRVSVGTASSPCCRRGATPCTAKQNPRPSTPSAGQQVCKGRKSPHAEVVKGTGTGASARCRHKRLPASFAIGDVMQGNAGTGPSGTVKHLGGVGDLCRQDVLGPRRDRSSGGGRAV